MKNIFLIIGLSILLIGCSITPRLGTEGYIKRNIEKHLINEFSEIQIFTIGQSVVFGVEGKGGGYMDDIHYFSIQAKVCFHICIFFLLRL
jgi:hypothetical protein